jgi:hypothetical protein
MSLALPAPGSLIVVGVIRLNVCKKMMMSPCLMLVVTFMAAVCMRQFVVMKRSHQVLDPVIR